MITFATRGKGQPPAYRHYRGPVLVDPCRRASAIDARSDETRNAAQPAGRERGPKGDAKTSTGSAQ